MIREGRTEKAEMELATEGSREDHGHVFFPSFFVCPHPLPCFYPLLCAIFADPGSSGSKMLSTLCVAEC